MDAKETWKAEITPCRLEESDPREGGCWTIVRWDAPDKVTVVCSTRWRPGTQYRADERYAKLIAGAPELLEAMKWVLGEIQNLDDVPQRLEKAVVHADQILTKCGDLGWNDGDPAS